MRRASYQNITTQHSNDIWWPTIWIWTWNIENINTQITLAPSSWYPSNAGYLLEILFIEHEYNSGISRVTCVFHYNDVIMGAMASQINSLTIDYSTIYSDADQRKHQSSASLAFVRGIHRSLVNSPHKWLVTRKIFPFDDVIMNTIRHAHS